MPQLPPRWFHYYKNGKAAVRVGPGIRPLGCHRFTALDRDLATVTLDHPRVLHYANPGFAAFWQRYQMWGRFPDVWFGHASIRERIGDLHLDARDVIARGDPIAARALYRERVVIEDAGVVNELIARGVCERIASPGQALRGELAA